MKKSVELFYIKFKKIVRYISIYGVQYTFFKIIARQRISLFKIPSNHKANIGVIGTGQFSFSTIGYWLYKNVGNMFVGCYDINEKSADSFRKFYDIKDKINDIKHLLNNPKIDIIYIASNHNTHCEYALSVLSANKIAYIEKPICTNYEQLNQLSLISVGRENKIFAGYNRPFSKAIKTLKTYSSVIAGPFNMNIFVIGHFIDDTHWYKNKNEGSRICGNMGHWIDLAVHVLNWKAFPEKIEIEITKAGENVDENIIIILKTDKGDLISLFFSIKNDPFEGVSEYINFHQKDLISSIDNFRSMKIWSGDKYKKIKFNNKDAGHEGAILQPFNLCKSRSRWDEVQLSTLIMLKISELVKTTQSKYTFVCKEEISQHLINI